MAIDARRRRHTSLSMLVVAALGLGLMGAQCTSVRPPPLPPGPVSDFAAEFRAAAALLAKRTGLAAKKVEDEIREANPGLTEKDLLDVAQNAADFWEAMDKLAQQTEQETRSLIARSTCHWLKPSGMSEEERNADLQTYIRSQPSVARLVDPEAKVTEVINGITAQMDLMRARGVTDRDAMVKEAVCWVFQL